MPGPFAYLGLSLLGYPSYRDEATGKTLVAQPGQSYGITAVEDGLPVPPGDGRWSSAAPAETAWEPPPAPPPPPPVPEVPQPDTSTEPEEQAS